MDRLKAENKVEYLDKQSDINIIKQIDDTMLSVRRDYQIKERNSQITASKVILTA